jgi:uncharacterized protein (UPF0332 family)
VSAGVQPGTAILLGKAERAARAAADEFERGASELAAGRAFYAVLYAAKALLSEHGVRLRTHDRIVDALGRLDDADTRRLSEWLRESVERRRSAETEVTHDDAAALCARAEQAVSLARRVLT